MTDPNVPIELPNEDTNQEETEVINDKPEQKSSNQTVPDVDDVQSFCAEFHIKVENAAGIRPWLQFSDTDFPGN